METWDYRMPREFMFVEQSDWNQTIVTKFNELSLGMSTYDAKKRIVVPEQFKGLIESLAYYKDELIGDNYRVIFTESEMPVILVEGKQLYILNYPK